MSNTIAEATANLPEVNVTDIVGAIEKFVTEDVDPKTLDAIAGCGIVFGLVFALFGSRNIRFGSMVVGCAVGAAVGEFLATHLRAESDIRMHVAIVAVSGLVLGLLSVCLLRVAKVLIGCSLGLIVASYISRTGLPALIGHDWILWSLLAILLVACALVSYFVFLYAVAVACAGVGGVVWSVSLNHFLDTGVSVDIFVSHFKTVSCKDNIDCWSVFLSGFLLTLIGTLLGWRSVCSNSANSYKALGDAKVVEGSGDTRSTSNSRRSYKVVHVPTSMQQSMMNNSEGKEVFGTSSKNIIIIPVP